MKILKTVKEKSTMFLRLICFMVVAVLVRQFYLDIINFPFIFETNIYESFGISDWLINYQAGFVRRGLAGEILYHIYQWHPFQIIYAIIGISTVCLIGLTILCVWLFKQMSWPAWLLVFPMFLYYRYYGLGMGIIDSRRDAPVLLLVFLLFWLYKHYLNKNGIVILGVWGLSVLIMVFYEGIFFSVFPILFLYTIMYFKNNGNNWDWLKRTLLLWWPVGAVLLLIVFNHGDRNAAEIIWQSWMPYFETYSFDGTLPDIGAGVESLDGNLVTNHHLAFGVAWKSKFLESIPVWPFNIYVIIAIYYLFTRMDVFASNKSITDTNRIQMSNILLLQLLFTMPMLGILTNDWYRTVPYICITTCFLCYLLPDRAFVPKFVDELSICLQSKIDRRNILCNPYFYLFVIITLPLCLYNARPGGMFPMIPIDVKHRLFVLFGG